MQKFSQVDYLADYKLDLAFQAESGQAHEKLWNQHILFKSFLLHSESAELEALMSQNPNKWMIAAGGSLTNRGFNEKNWVRKPCWLLKDQLSLIQRGFELFIQELIPIYHRGSFWKAILQISGNIIRQYYFMYSSIHLLIGIISPQVFCIYLLVICFLSVNSNGNIKVLGVQFCHYVRPAIAIIVGEPKQLRRQYRRHKI
ncbi:Hypothetical_protein [Hexamita inflata]|uniref:Hypothetical_protein n=1 Tax=Hexamita inflata TaxID=28002 RepID=A0AA86R5Q2_9EUKA|nr:Hypothetical protein HINF_LOCUS50230 [Hexamita inflata]